MPASAIGADFAGGTALTPLQATELSAMLFNDYDTGGATFRPPWPTDGGIAGLPAAMAARGQPAVRWVARPLSPDSRVPLEVVLNVVLRLASDQRENPLLLRQRDTAFLCEEQVDGIAVNVYRFGARTVYWVDQQSGRLRKVAARLEVANGVTEIVLHDHRALTVLLPTATEVVAAETIPDVLARLEAPAAAVPGVTRPG